MADPPLDPLEEGVQRLTSIRTVYAYRLLAECQGWAFAVEQGLVTQEEAEARATRRAAVILHRAAPRRR